MFEAASFAEFPIDSTIGTLATALKAVVAAAPTAENMELNIEVIPEASAALATAVKPEEILAPICNPSWSV